MNKDYLENKSENEELSEFMNPLLSDLFGFTYNDYKNHDFMRTDISTTKEAFILEIEVPSVKKEDIKIDFLEGNLTVSVKRTNSQENVKVNYLSKERFQGEFSRKFYLGDKIDSEHIEASLKEGILTIKAFKIAQKEKKYISIE